MIEPAEISCTSELHDSVGVIFEYRGRVLRALSARGRHIVNLLSKNGWLGRLYELGPGPFLGDRYQYSRLSWRHRNGAD